MTESLPTEILDMILNGVDERGVPFLHPAWRFAARMTHPRWAAVIASAGAVGPERANLLRDAWASRAGGNLRSYHCRCSICECGVEEHADFGACLASGRLVSARCAVGRRWVFNCCRVGTVPIYHWTIVDVLSMSARSSDTGRSASVVASLGIDDDRGDDDGGGAASQRRPTGRPAIEIGAFLCEALRRGFFAVEFMQDLCGVLVRCDRADLVRGLVAVYPDLDRGHAAERLFLDACLNDSVEIVEDALLRVYLSGDDTSGLTDIVRKWRIWKDAAAGGTALLERLLFLCGHRDRTVALDKQAMGASKRDKADREVRLSVMARLTRPTSDLSWQKSAVRSGNVEALVLGERYGVAVCAHQLAAAADPRAGHACSRWIAARMLAERASHDSLA
ncbi:hypothetical protein psal_cds_252 [Pandoravirus salinus]|uniref:F-box incomplete domain containing protein n=1 Tax=Pandoravirus salinus TaxID=1349410 RepID=S4VTK2_9VIRU|nr:hypothetical protein psal_cds_252 [Pandoravirus salinus]AGO83809.1 hypothetical protein psal_cds_252 [Pandoravirus salinus]